LRILHAMRYLAFSIHNLSANKASEDYHAVFSRLQREKRSLFQNMICCAEAESLASLTCTIYTDGLLYCCETCKYCTVVEKVSKNYMSKQFMIILILWQSINFEESKLGFLCETTIKFLISTHWLFHVPFICKQSYSI
jgi:hypothetical protein